MVGKVKVNEGITDGVAERVVERSAALVTDSTFVEGDRFWDVGKRRRRWSEKEEAAEQSAKEEEERESEGSEEGGEDGTQEIDYLHLYLIYLSVSPTSQGNNVGCIFFFSLFLYFLFSSHKLTFNQSLATNVTNPSLYSFTQKKKLYKRNLNACSSSFQFLLFW